MDTDNYKLTITQTPDDLKPNEISKRTGTVKFTNNESLPQLRVQLPLTFDGPTNGNDLEKFLTPEHLFLSAVSSCFMTTFLVISKNSNLAYINISIDTDSVIDTPNGKKMAEIIQNITLTISEGVSEKKALKVLEITANYCILGNSVKSKVTNNYKVVVDKSI